jgi:hypothetical protein
MEQYVGHINNKGQTVQTDNTAGVLNKITDLENFDRDIPYSFLEKKAEKLSTAIYLITGFLSDSEPIKWQIRGSGLSILSDVISLSDGRMSDMAYRVKNITSDIGKITALFEIAATAGFVSTMNLAILKEEYGSLVEVIENRKIGKAEDKYMFSRDFFSISEQARSVSKERFPQDFYKGHIKKDNGHGSYEDKGQHTEKNEHSHFARGIEAENVSAKKESKNSRRETILRLIKDKGEHAEVSIKDIVGYFHDCGEKTIQRELTALVREGVLKKTGERRWSRYSL